MKRILLITLFISSISLVAQQKQFEINWNGTIEMQATSMSFQLPAFDKEHFGFDLDRGIMYSSQWQSSQAIDEQSAKLEAVTYATISKQELKSLPLNLIPTQPQLVIRNSIARNDRYLHLELTPIIYKDGVYRKITSFSVSYTGNIRNRTARRSPPIGNSVLSEGEWKKFYVESSGIVKLSKGFLNSIGVNTNVDPRDIKIYGNGGAMLPMLNSEPYPFDLEENAIKFVGEQDGKFDNNDYILFYAEGPTGYNSVSNTNINAYTDKAYYFITTSGNSAGKRIQSMPQPQAPPDLTINTFQDYQFYEVDLYNIAKLGRRWFGDRFDVEDVKDYSFNFPNLITTEPVLFKAYVASVSDAVTSMKVTVNGNTVASLRMNALTSGVIATGSSYVNTLNVNSDDITVNLDYDNGGNPSSLGYLDYISLEATRSLRYEGNTMFFKNNIVETSSGVAEYVLSNASPLDEVWDITDKYNVTSAANSGDASEFRFKAQMGELRTYITLVPQNYLEPLRDSKTAVANQNIKGTVFFDEKGGFQDPDYLIISPEIMLNQAERLAQINRDKYGLNVRVIELSSIYNEFSSGNQDVSAIRNLVKYVYDNASSPDKRLKYLCLFGDGSFDYKDRIPNNTNIVPTWHSYNSFSLTNAFVSDDYYGMMDENEGSMNSSDKLDIAVGRILADTPQRAVDLVNKIQTYYSPEAFGSWRNNVIAVSDDVDQAWERVIQNTTNQLANAITENKPSINAIKIHSDAFLQEASSAGERYPQVNKTLKDAIEVGALVVNYFGHGGENGLALERIFDINDSQEIRNTCKYNLFVTVTCEYTKFDDPLRETAGEFTYWNKDGGSIALITTTRQIFVTVGVSFNEILEKYLYGFGSDELPTMAEALRMTKNDPNLTGGDQRRLVFFIGDPAMKLALPQPGIRLTQINDKPITSQSDVLQALGRVKMSGEIVNPSGNIISNYNGVLTASVFDKPIERQTLANDGTQLNGELIRLDFETLGEILFKGQATIANGRFEFNFVVPKDIVIPVGNGKVSFYAKRTGILEDRSGANFNVRVGGINENAAEDNVGPTIQVYMNDENFVSGGITNEAPTLLVKLQDENGINTASGIGHDITAIIDGDETNPYILNDYYQADVDNFQKGELSYAFRDLEPGLHTLTLKAWDVYNNSSTVELEFVVYDQNDELVINNVLNYPNPFIDYTEFWFNHNSTDVLDVSIQIFTVSGKLVRTLNGQTSGGSKVTSSLSKDIVWDGRDDFGDKIGKGVYVYKLKVRSNRLNKQVEKIEKLVIL